MELSQINKILEQAENTKAEANSNTSNYTKYLEAANLYTRVYDLCIESQEIEAVAKDIFSTVYKYEELDCLYSYEIKIKDFTRAKLLNSEQKQITEKIINAYSLDSLSSTQLKNLYQGFVEKRITLALQAFQPIAKTYLDEKNYKQALYYYRRSEEVLSQVNISSLTDDFLITYNKNFHIVRFNISQCQIGIYYQEVNKDQFLEKSIIKSLLACINETNDLILLNNSDLTYRKGLEELENKIAKILKETKIEWSILIEENKNDQSLKDILRKIDFNKFNLISRFRKDHSLKEERILFYTHGFNTRGRWKEIFTESISDMERGCNVHFIQRPWDYGRFVFQFFMPWRRKRAVRNFLKVYQEICDRYGSGFKKCLVAHSFGTYITGTALQKDVSVKFERIVYVGNILNVGFDWQKLKNNGQCDKVFIEISTDDIAVWAGQQYRNIFIWAKWIGCAGRKGFSKDYEFVEVRKSKSGHSGMINKENMKGPWFNFLIS